MPPTFTRIATYTTPHEAEIVRGMLREHGIDAVLRDDVTVQMNWLYSNVVGGVKLLVPTSDLADARELLNLTDEPTDEDTGSETTQCPNCHGTQVTSLRPPLLFGILMLLFLLPFGYRRDRYRCETCGTTW